MTSVSLSRELSPVVVSYATSIPALRNAVSLNSYLGLFALCQFFFLVTFLNHYELNPKFTPNL